MIRACELDCLLLITLCVFMMAHSLLNKLRLMDFLSFVLFPNNPIFMKKIIKLSSIALLATMPLVVSAQTMSPPSLMDTLEFNEKVFKVQNRLNLKEKIQLKRQQEAQKNQPLSYKSIKKGKAIEVFKYDVANIWVQKINLTQGAKIDSIINQYGYDAQLSEPLFAKKSLKDQVKSLKNTPFSIINGQFFNPRRSATTLSF